MAAFNAQVDQAEKLAAALLDDSDAHNTVGATGSHAPTSSTNDDIILDENIDNPDNNSGKVKNKDKYSLFNLKKDNDKGNANETL